MAHTILITMNGEAASAVSAARETTVSIDGITVAAGEASAALAKMGAAAKAGAGAAAEQNMAKLGATTKATTGSMLSLSKAMSGLLVGGVVAVGLTKATEAAAGFQHSMELIRTQAGGTQAEVVKMTAAVMGLAPAVGQGPKALADALFYAESAGIRGARAMQALKIAAEGAAVGGSNLSETMDALVGAMKTGIEGTQNISHAMGELNAIVGAGKMHMQDLVDSFKTALLPTAKAVGASLQDVGAALAVMTDRGVPAARAATYLRQVFIGMQASTEIAKKGLDSIGISSSALADTLANKGLIPALELLKTKMEEAGKSGHEQAALLAQVFGKEAMSGILTLLNGLDDMKVKFKQIGDGATGFGAAWAATQKTAQFSMDRFHASLQLLEVTLGNELLPLVAKLANQFSDWIAKAQKTGELKADMKDVASAVSGIADAVKIVIKAFQLFAGAVGGVKNAVELLLALKLVSMLGGWKLAMKAFGDQAVIAEGEAVGLKGTLLGLPKAVPITISLAIIGAAALTAVIAALEKYASFGLANTTDKNATGSQASIKIAGKPIQVGAPGEFSTSSGGGLQYDNGQWYDTNTGQKITEAEAARKLGITPAALRAQVAKFNATPSFTDTPPAGSSVGGDTGAKVAGGGRSLTPPPGTKPKKGVAGATGSTVVPGEGGIGTPQGAGLTLGRTDAGVDFGGTGYILAVDDGKVTYLGTAAQNAKGGGGPFMIYQITSGKFIYVAEKWIPLVKVGDTVKKGQPIGKALGSIEIGYAAGPSGTWNTAAGAAGYKYDGTASQQGSDFASAISGATPPAGSGSGSTGQTAAQSAAARLASQVAASKAAVSSIVSTANQDAGSGTLFGALRKGLAAAADDITAQLKKVKTAAQEAKVGPEIAALKAELARDLDFTKVVEGVRGQIAKVQELFGTGFLPASTEASMKAQIASFNGLVKKDLADGVITSDELSKIRAKGDQLKAEMKNLLDLSGIDKQAQAQIQNLNQLLAGGLLPPTVQKATQAALDSYNQALEKALLHPKNSGLVEKVKAQFGDLQRAASWDSLVADAKKGTADLQAALDNGLVTDKEAAKATAAMKNLNAAIAQGVRDFVKYGAPTAADIKKLAAAWAAAQNAATPVVNLAASRQAMRDSVADFVSSLDAAGQAIGLHLQTLVTPAMVSAAEAKVTALWAALNKGGDPNVIGPKLAKEKDIIMAGVGAIVDQINTDTAALNDAWSQFGDAISSGFDQAVTQKFSQGVASVNDVFTNAQNLSDLKKAQATYAQAAGADPTLKGMLDKQIQMWNDYYADLEAGRFDDAKGLATQLVANQDAMDSYVAGLSDDQKQAAAALVAAGGDVVNAIKTTGDKAVAEAQTTWENVSAVQKAAVLAAVADAQAALDSGQIKLPEALDRIKAALVANGMDPADADKLLANPIVASIDKLTTALNGPGGLVDVLTKLLAFLTALDPPDPLAKTATEAETSAQRIEAALLAVRTAYQETATATSPKIPGIQLADDADPTPTPHNDTSTGGGGNPPIVVTVKSDVPVAVTTNDPGQGSQIHTPGPQFAEGGEVNTRMYATIGEGGHEMILPTKKIPAWLRGDLTAAIRDMIAGRFDATRWASMAQSWAGQTGAGSSAGGGGFTLPPSAGGGVIVIPTPIVAGGGGSLGWKGASPGKTMNPPNWWLPANPADPVGGGPTVVMQFADANPDPFPYLARARQVLAGGTAAGRQPDTVIQSMPARGS